LLNSNGRAAINKKGNTQLRLRFFLDDNNDGGADYLLFSSGDAATASDRPKFMVYFVP